LAIDFEAVNMADLYLVLIIPFFFNVLLGNPSPMPENDVHFHLNLADTEGTSKNRILQMRQNETGSDYADIKFDMAEIEERHLSGVLEEWKDKVIPIKDGNGKVIKAALFSCMSKLTKYERRNKSICQRFNKKRKMNHKKRPYPGCSCRCCKIDPYCDAQCFHSSYLQYWCKNYPQKMRFVTSRMISDLVKYRGTLRGSKDTKYIDPNRGISFVRRMAGRLAKHRRKFYENEFRRKEHDEVGRKLWEEDMPKIIHSCPINPCELTAPDCNLPAPTTSTMPPPTTRPYWWPTTTTECPAYWSTWGDFGRCQHVQGNQGKRVRTRECVENCSEKKVDSSRCYPLKLHDGIRITKTIKTDDEVRCYIDIEPTEPEFTEWSSWIGDNTCHFDGVTSIKYKRVRTCIKAKKHPEKDCIGPNTEEKRVSCQKV